MKKLIPFLLLPLVFSACQEDPGTDNLDDKVLVITSYDDSADFKQFSTYYVPDSILLISESSKATYDTGTQSELVIAAFISGLNKAGYTQVADKSTANIGLQISYIKSTYFISDYYGTNPWWYGYPSYWNGYWGTWGGGFYYPYAITYGYSVGGYIAELVDLTETQGSNQSLNVLWTAYLNGFTTSEGVPNTTYIIEGINQAFAQSTYLNH